MTSQPSEDTTPNPVHPNSEPGIQETPVETKPRKKSHGRWILYGILTIIVLTAIGAAVGYGLAIQKRKAAEQDQRYVAATTQFELALQDQRMGNLSMARNRIEYVMTVYPEFPGASDKLAEILLAIGTSSTPVATAPSLVPTPEPTKDTRAVSELFQALKTQYGNKDWDTALQTVRSIRDADPSFEVIKVDGMYYGALRNAGISMIQKGNLETGLYYLALAETMAPIDTDAESYRVWSRMYLTGASWWGINWEKVTLYFSQLNDMVPDLIDSSGMTVRSRLTKALEAWGDQLAATGDFCSAVPKYEASLKATNSKAMEDKLGAARASCETQPPATDTPQPTPTETITPTPEVTPTS
jgi:tetratricopeptide (TPR) repeat protein